MSKQTAKEIVYDEQVSPLIKNIVDICENAGISFSAVFDISGPEDKPLVCSTQMPDENGVWSPYIHFVDGRPSPLDRPNPGYIGE